MTQDSVIADIEKRAREARISIRALCDRADVHPTTFSRWKRSKDNPKPAGASLISIGRLYAELDKIDAEDARRLRKSGKAVAA